MATLTQSVAIGDTELHVNSAFADGSFPGYVKIDSEMLSVGGAEWRTGLTLVLSKPATATHSSGATVTYAGNPFDADFLSATSGGGSGVTVDNQSDPPAAVTDIVAPGATIEGDTATVFGVVISQEDPWATSSALFWLRLLPGQNSFQLYAREATDGDWVLASAAIGAGDIGDGFADQQERRVGLFTDFDGGDYTGLIVNTTSASLVRTAANGDVASVTLGTTLARLNWAGASPMSVTLSDAGLVVLGLPTANPNVAGALWNDGGTLKVSAG